MQLCKTGNKISSRSIQQYHRALALPVRCDAAVGSNNLATLNKPAASNLANPDLQKDYENWKESGPARAGLHMLVGGLTGGVGGVGGALGAGVSQTAIPHIGVVAGAAGGGGGALAGAAAGQNATANNYLTHLDDMLGGASAQVGVCVGVWCGGVNQSFGPPGRAPTAVEFGIGTPGASVSIGVSQQVTAAIKIRSKIYRIAKNELEQASHHILGTISLCMYGKTAVSMAE